MRAFAVTCCVALILFMTTTWSSSNLLPEGTTVENLEIKVAEQNPWTNLELNNRRENFQFAIVTDRTGGRGPASSKVPSPRSISCSLNS